MDNVKGRILLKQQISNLKEVGFEDIERTVNVTNTVYKLNPAVFVN